MVFSTVSQTQVRAGLSIEHHRSDSGLEILLAPAASAPLVSYQSWFRVGSRDEAPRRSGLAHLFEHLMFTQTDNHGFGEFDHLIERCGGDSNAATSVDWTFYRDSVPSSHLEAVVRLEADRLQHLQLTREVLEVEREVVLHERQQCVDDDLGGFLDEELHRLAYSVHPYGHPVIGWREDICALTTSVIHEFYREYYTASNLILVVTGQFDPEQLLDHIGRCYESAPTAPAVRAPVAPEPLQTEARFRRFDKEISAERALIAFKIPESTHPDWIALDVLASLLTNGASSRLHRQLVIRDELASSVHAGVSPFRDPGLFTLAVQLRRGIPYARAEEALEAELATLRRGDIAERELDKIKNSALTDFWCALTSLDGRAEVLGHAQATLGDYRALFEQERALRALTTEDLARVADTYLHSRVRSTVVAGPPRREGDSR